MRVMTTNSMTEQNNNTPDPQTLLPQNEEEIMISNEVVVDSSTILNNDPAVRMSLPFVHKLYLMLNDMEANGYDHIISWIGDGKAFKIHDPSLFEALIQPKYFRQSRLASFIRQASLEFLAIQALTV
jgi:HSF-type DNA-binding